MKVNKMIKIGIVGASGYTGAELVRLLDKHPEVQVNVATSETYANQKLSELYPALGESGDITLSPLAKADLSTSNVDLVFLGLPHGEAMKAAPALVDSGVKVIDLSGDFRLQDTDQYETWYQHKHTAKEWVTKAVYGLPELFRDKIKSAVFVSNPGCYVTAAVLALYPMVKSNAIETKSLIVDAKSGISGAGRKAKPETHFNRISENIIPYKMAGTHQHTPEMEMALSQATGQEVVITFSPQVIPARRGILVTAYGKLNKPMSTEEIASLYQKTYEKEAFVRVLTKSGAWPDLSSSVGSNMCVVKADMDSRTNTVIMTSSMDNLIKGASGQAIQNMNLMLGLDEGLGLPRNGLIP
jgi:N-acetyl-gamma-glutamyl-phosphate reductase